MKLGAFSFAQGLRFFALNEATFYAPDAIKSIKERYGFVRVPESPNEMMPMGEGKPMMFQHGKFTLDLETGPVPIVVRALHLYRQGITVEVNTDFTDQCDLVLDDFVSWFPWIATRMSLRLYVSRLEVSFDDPVDRAWPMANQLGVFLGHKLAGYGIGPQVPDFQVATLALNRDPQLAFLPCDFRIEKREGAPYEQNLYFSQAPLATNDHLELLALLEKLLADLGAPTSASPNEPPPPSSQSPSSDDH